MTPAIALRNACRALILADPAFTALAVDRMHDRVPSGSDKPVFPFGAFGPMRQERLETGNDPAKPVKIRLYAASTEYERDQAWDLAEVLAGTLEGALPQLEGGYALAGELVVTMSGDAIASELPRSVFVDVVGTVYRAA